MESLFTLRFKNYAKADKRSINSSYRSFFLYSFKYFLNHRLNQSLGHKHSFFSYCFQVLKVSCSLGPPQVAALPVLEHLVIDRSRISSHYCSALEKLWKLKYVGPPSLLRCGRHYSVVKLPLLRPRVLLNFVLARWSFIVVLEIVDMKMFFGIGVKNRTSD